MSSIGIVQILNKKDEHVLELIRLASEGKKRNKVEFYFLQMTYYITFRQLKEISLRKTSKPNNCIGQDYSKRLP